MPLSVNDTTKPQIFLWGALVGVVDRYQEAAGYTGRYSLKEMVLVPLPLLI